MKQLLESRHFVIAQLLKVTFGKARSNVPLLCARKAQIQTQNQKFGV